MSRTTLAMKSLIETSALSSHSQTIYKSVNIDDHYIDDEWLAEWNWSSGEKVLIEVLKVLARGHGYCRLDDLFKLDQENQASVLLALKIRLGLTEDFGSVVG